MKKLAKFNATVRLLSHLCDSKRQRRLPHDILPSRKQLSWETYHYVNEALEDTRKMRKQCSEISLFYNSYSEPKIFFERRHPHTAEARFACVCARWRYAKRPSKNDYEKNSYARVNFHPNPNRSGFKMLSRQKFKKKWPRGYPKGNRSFPRLSISLPVGFFLWKLPQNGYCT